MKNKFEELLGLLQKYVDKSVDVRNTIAKITANADISQSKKEQDTIKLKAELVTYGEECISKAEKIIDSIIFNAQAGKFELKAVSALIDYITACKGVVDAEVLSNQIDVLRGDVLGLKAIYSVLEANNAPINAKKVVSDLFYEIKDIESTLKAEIALVFVGSASATNCGRKICKEAYLLGVDVTSNVKDEFSDEQMLRRVAGLI